VCAAAPVQALPEFHQRVEVLQGLNYLDAEKAVTLKGRVLCEINSTQVGAAESVCGCRDPLMAGCIGCHLLAEVL
jgi:hypothetical protein